jgi:predicted nucleic acid-binding Zn ribbon protein
MSELPISNCENCGGKVKRLITGGTGLIFKGTGFYLTDYKNGGKSKDSEKPAASGKEKSEKPAKTEKGEKPAPKAKESSSKKKRE